MGTHQTSSSDRSNHPREFRIFHALDVDGDGLIGREELVGWLESAGLLRTDPRLAGLMQALEPLSGPALDLADFSSAVSTAGVLVESAVQGSLTIPDFSTFRDSIAEIFAVVSHNDGGKQADYIPPLADVDPDGFGVSLVTVDGQCLNLGDASADFSIQSTCKPFNYCFALEELGEEAVHRHIGREPSGRGFNAYVLQADNRPHNPMINAGAIMCASLIKRDLPAFKRLRHVSEAWRGLTGGTAPRFDAYMAMEEDRTGDRNRALAYMMKNEGAFPGGEDFEDSDLRSTLEVYFKTCSFELNATEMAMAAATLANGGVNPATRERALAQETVRSCLSLMYSCGMYDFSGEFAFSIGVPAKSGVGGAVILVVPGMFGLCVWSPRLDAVGNSVRGVDFATRLVRDYALHVFDGVTSTGTRLDPRVSRSRRRAGLTAQALWAASTGDIGTVRRLAVEGFQVENGDYDGRTALHLAATEGHADIVRLLLTEGADVAATDRWGATAHDDAISGNHEEIVAMLEAAGAVPTSRTPRAAQSMPVPSEQGATADMVDVVMLLWAAAEGALSDIIKLVASGISVNVADYDGRTALHLAAAEGHQEVVVYLLSHGAERSPSDRWGATPIEEARRSGHSAIASLLEADSPVD